MARTDPPEDFTERIVDIDVSREMESSFLEYAYSVIYSRALPDARDGLKPVQRRILFTMSDMGVRPDKPHVKSARVVGQVMGQLHPHGDSAIYDALVRLAQPWSMRLPMVDGHGNFGAPDSGPAAMRYTECRMDPAAVAMCAGLDEDTVEFRPNYDGKETEPAVLPAAIPHLLVNGGTGIAVGMATSLAPHNLGEVVSGLKHLLAHPDATTTELMQFIPGPDLPTGGSIVGLSGVADAYETGRGSFKVRATTTIEQVTPRRKGIVITEMPYNVGPEKFIEQVKTLVQAKKLTGIADIKDLTDLTHGTRLVVEVKNGINPEALLAQLFQRTKLEDSFSINAVALVDGQPRTLPLKEMLQVFLDHRLDVVLRRSRHRLAKASERLHLVEGLLLAILDIDDVIAIIRRSDDAAAARSQLMDVFDLTEPQATYILDLQLRRLTRFSTIELESERDDLNKRISELQRIIDDPQVLADVVSGELDEVADRFGSPRRTVLLASSAATTPTAAVPLEVPDVACRVMLSATGRIARIDAVTPLEPSAERRPHDALASAIVTSSRAELGAMTSTGLVHRLSALDLPALPGTATIPALGGGAPLDTLLPMEPKESVLGLTTLNEESPGWLLVTRQGVVKRVTFDQIGKPAWEIIRLDGDDTVVGAVELTPRLTEVVMVTSDAQLLRFGVDKLRAQGRSGGGVAGIRLSTGASVVWGGAVDPEETVVVTAAGSDGALPGTAAMAVKVTPLSAYPVKGRATGGVRCQRLLKGQDALVMAWVGPQPAMGSSSDGTPVPLPEIDERRDGSGAPVSSRLALVGRAH